MAIVQPGEKLPTSYLDRFEPAENVVYRLSVLSTAAIAREFHWVDLPSKDTKGTYQCIQGICCQALGRRSQDYNVPIYVYRQQGSTEGDLYIWRMTPARWKKFSDLALQVDLTQYDLTFSAHKQGFGMDWSYSVIPDQKYRDYWSPEQKEQLRIATESFYQMGEASMSNPMSYNDWAQLLHELGYDVNNQCWPGGQSPMNSGNAFGAIGRAVGVGASLPPPPPAGFTQAAQVQQVPNMSTGIVLQPNPPASFGQVPQALQQQVIHPIPQASSIPIDHGSNVSPTPLPQPVAPLGTAPVIPQPVAQVSPAQSATPVSTGSTVNNTVPSGVQEITADELNAMLAV